MVTLALVSPTRNRRSRAQTPIFKIENQDFLVQMAQAWPGPAQAQPGARFWKSGDLEILKFRIQTISKMKILKIRIRSAQNVGKVWIGQKNTFPAPFGAIPGNFLHGPKKSTNLSKITYFPWWANWPYSPGVGAERLSTGAGNVSGSVSQEGCNWRKSKNVNFHSESLFCPKGPG